MKQFSMETLGNDALLVYHLAENESFDNFAKGMLQNNEIIGLIRPSFTQRNLDRYLKYAVTSRIPLSEFLYGSPVKKETLMKILISLAEAVKNASEYLLGEERILLSPDEIYVNISTKQVSLIYLPLLDFVSETSLREMILSLLISLRYEIRGDLEYVARIITFLNEKKQLDPEELLNALRQIEKADSKKGKDETPENAADGPRGQNNNLQGEPVLRKEEQASKNPQESLSLPPGQQGAMGAGQFGGAIPKQPGAFTPVQVQTPPLEQPPTPMDFPGLVPVNSGEEEKKKKKLFFFGGKEKKKKSKKEPAAKPEKSMPSPLNNNDMNIQIPGQDPMAGMQIPGNGVQAEMQIPGQEKQGNGVFGVSFPEPEVKKEKKKGLFGNKDKLRKSDEGIDFPMPAESKEEPVNVNPPLSYDNPSYKQKPAQSDSYSKDDPSVEHSIIFGSGTTDEGTSTVLLGGGRQEGRTTLLDDSSTGTDGVNRELRPAKLTRIRTHQTVTINQTLFHIGSEGGFVDFYISDNRAISGLHADIVAEDGKYFIVDKNSKNHTYVNEVQIVSGTKTPLASGDRVRLANEEFEFRIS